MRFHQEDGSPYVVRSRYYRQNPHFRPATVVTDAKPRKSGFLAHRGKWFWIECVGAMAIALVLVLLVLFPNEIDAWVRRHFPDRERVMPQHAVATFHNSKWTPPAPSTPPPPPPAH